MQQNRGERGERGADYQYTPDGFPWGRFALTAGLLVLFGLVVMSMLLNFAKMDAEEENLIFFLAGAMVSMVRETINWWFRHQERSDS